MTLKEYVDFCYSMGETRDKEIILDYIKINNMEGWAIKAMADISYNAMNKLENSISICRSWSGCVSWQGLTEQYDVKTAELLANWQEYVIARVGLVIDEDLLPVYFKELKEIVPTLELPKGAFFRNALDELHKLGIYFKDEEKEEIKCQ